MIVECIRFTPFNSGCLRGFAELYVPEWNMRIRGIKLFEKDGSRWITFPSEKYKDKEGQDKFAPLVKFTEGSFMERFCEQAKQAIDDWVAENTYEKPHQEPEYEDLF